MSESLGIGDFRWLNDTEIEPVRYIADNGDIGYVLEVDLKYGNHLHELHNDYPLATESITVTECMLSDYCKSLFVKTFGKPYHSTPKLIPNLQKTNTKTKTLYCEL